MNISAVIQRNDTTSGRVFDYFVQALILFSIVTFSVGTLPNLSPGVQQLLTLSEIIIVVFFTLEYTARIWFASNRLGYVFSFYGFIDLLAILPFYLALGVDLRSLRAFRMLRLLRVFKVLRYSDALQRLSRAMVIAKEELLVFGLVTLILLYLAAVGIYYFEHAVQPDAFASIFHSLWWAVTTLTTVGYGDIYPITLGGRVFTFFILMIGLGIVAVPAGVLSSALSAAKVEINEGREG